MTPFLSYTVHFIDNEWTLKTRCLETYMPQDHTADNLAEAMVNMLESWNLDVSKQVCLTTDNGSNVTCATICRLSWNHLPCFGHNLNLGVTKSIKDDTRVSHASGVCRKIVSNFSHSWKHKRDLGVAQEQLGLPKHSLVIDCVMRWGSTQKMVERIVEQKQAIHQVLSQDRKSSHLLPKWQDIEVLEALNAVLDPLATFTDTLSGETQVTVSCIKPILYILQSDVCAEQSSDTQLTSDIKQRVLGYMAKSYSDPKIEELINIASYVDPRFMADYLEDTEYETVTDRLIDEGQLYERPEIGQEPTNDVQCDNSD